MIMLIISSSRCI